MNAWSSNGFGEKESYNEWKLLPWLWIVLQSVDPAKPGYIPAEALNSKNQLICQRCFRMIHYGEVGPFHPDPLQITKNIQKAIAISDLLVITIDFSDLTGTLPVWSDFIPAKPYILVINKSDLLPARTKQLEIKEYIKQYLQNHNFKSPQDLILTSGLKGDGVNILAKVLAKTTAPGGKIAILGVTNVGKSSLIKYLLSLEGSQLAPTVSVFPGTTMGLSNWSILAGRNTLIDTPGLVTGDRMSDLFCPKCASALASQVKIAQKLLNLKAGKALILSGLLGIEYCGQAETIIIAFHSPELTLHRTDSSKLPKLMTEGPAWLVKICQSCHQGIVWQEQLVQLENNQDLAIAGLGWISQRGPSTDFKIILPQGIRFEIRPALVGKR